MRTSISQNHSGTRTVVDDSEDSNAVTLIVLVLQEFIPGRSETCITDSTLVLTPFSSTKSCDFCSGPDILASKHKSDIKIYKK